MTKRKAAMISNGQWRKKHGLPPKSVPGSKGKARLAATGTPVDLAGATIDGTPPSGAVVALMPDNPSAFAVDGGDAPEALHVTLKFLGSADEWDDNQRRLVEGVVSGWADKQGVFDGEVGGVGTLGSDGAVVYLLDVDGLSDARQELSDAIDVATDKNTVDSHDAFTPHLTAGYGVPMPDRPDITASFSKVRVGWGPSAVEFPLGLGDDRAASDDVDDDEPGDGGDGGDVRLSALSPDLNHLVEERIAARHIARVAAAKSEATSSADRKRKYDEAKHKRDALGRYAKISGGRTVNAGDKVATPGDADVEVIGRSPNGMILVRRADGRIEAWNGDDLRFRKAGKGMATPRPLPTRKPSKPVTYHRPTSDRGLKKGDKVKTNDDDYTVTDDGLANDTFPMESVSHRRGDSDYRAVFRKKKK